MTGERNIDTTAAEEEFSAAAPPHPRARGTGETSFGDAEAPAAGGARAAGTPAGDAPAQESESPGGPAQEAAERETPETPGAGDPRSVSPDADKAAASSRGGAGDLRSVSPDADKAAASSRGGAGDPRSVSPDADKAAASSRGGAGDPRSVSPDADKAAEYLALAKRTQADFENYRKRMARENAAAANRGAGKLAKELLPALDHLDLALKAAAGHEDVIRGFAMVRDELIAALGRAGIEAFSPRGEAFDPSEHEAMAQLPAEDAEPGTVIEVYQQGYRIDGTVLRPARVVVAQ